jgi:hypothetical protein
MLKNILTLAFLFATTLIVKAQDEYISKKEVDVQIITNEGSVMTGKTRYTFISDLQEEIVFYDIHKEMQVFRPFEIKGFVIDGKKFISVEQKGLLAGLNRFFLHQNTEGAMNLYTVYFIQNPGMTLTQEYYIQKNNDKLYGTKSLKFLNFKKEMSAYVSEVKDLAARIADRTYTAGDIETIVDEYNGYFELQGETISSSVGK